MRRMNLLWLTMALSLAVACGGGDDDDEAPWTVVMEDQPSAFLSVWGGGPDDIWVVGGDARDDLGPAVHHWDGSTWERLDTEQRNVDLWWVFGFAGGPIYMGGSNGALLRYDGAFEVMETPGTPTVFGIWGDEPDDTWAVGGSIAGGAGGGFAWHYDGSAWTPESSLPTAIVEQGSVWKISGRGGDDIWMTGTTGFAAHWTGSTLETEQLPVDYSLFSVGSDGERFITVGGDFAGAVFENDGSGWVAATIPEDASPLSGVAASASASYAVGRGGTVLRRGESGWDSVDTGATIQDLHAAFVDAEGGVWIVGGEFDAPITSGGVLLYQGPQNVTPP
jgi:hypothetical protein